MAHISLPVLAKFLILIFRIEYLENADPASRAAMTHSEVDLPPAAFGPCRRRHVPPKVTRLLA
jgi:hypothetical protein